MRNSNFSIFWVVKVGNLNCYLHIREFHLNNKALNTESRYSIPDRITGGPVGGAAVSWPKGPGFDSHSTGLPGHASKPMEHGLWGFDQGVVPSKYQCDAVRSN